MNSFKIKSLDRVHTVVEYTIGKNVFSRTYDSRYIAIDDAAEVDKYFQNQLAGYAKDAEVEAVPAEVKAMVGKEVTLEVTPIE